MSAFGIVIGVVTGVGISLFLTLCGIKTSVDEGDLCGGFENFASLHSIYTDDDESKKDWEYGKPCFELRERHSEVKEFYRRNLHVNEPNLDGALERFMQERRQKRG